MVLAREVGIQTSQCDRLCITDTRYGYGDTAICEFKKRHSGSIERVSEYRSIEVSDTQVLDTGTAGLVNYR